MKLSVLHLAPLNGISSGHRAPAGVSQALESDRPGFNVGSAPSCMSLIQCNTLSNATAAGT